jgi:hypothetical protein
MDLATRRISLDILNGSPLVLQMVQQPAAGQAAAVEGSRGAAAGALLAAA